MNRLFGKNKEFILGLFYLLSILVLGSFLYLYRIDHIPPGLNPDEVPNGYNAYSLLLTGKDQYGKSFPISFRFSGTYSPPLYTYLTVPMVALLGLNLASTRMVSVVSGILSILVVFLLLKKLNITRDKTSVYLGTLLFTISPWAVMYSRSGYEAMLSFLMYTLGIVSIWIGFKKPLFLTIGILILSLSVYASYTNKFLIPIFLVCLILVFKNTLFNTFNKKYLLIGFIGAFILQLPNLTILFTQSFFVKTNLFYSDTLLTQYQNIKNIIPVYIGIPYLFIREFLAQYFTYFSLRSLFLDPDPFLGRSIPDLSVFYPWMVIPYLIGLYTVWKNRNQTNYKYLLIFVLTAPIPAALTKDPFWTYRAIPMLAPLIVIITIGIDKLAQLRFKLFSLLGCLVIAVSLILLWKGYFIFLPNERANAWQYGYQNLAQEITTHSSEHFVIDNTRSQLAFLQLAFFMKLPPQILQDAADQQIKKNYYNNTTIDYNYSFENVEVRAIHWKTDIYKNQILVGDTLTISSDQVNEHVLTQLFQIKDPLQNIVFVGYKTDPLKKCERSVLLHKIPDPLCQSI